MFTSQWVRVGNRTINLAHVQVILENVADDRFSGERVTQLYFAGDPDPVRLRGNDALALSGYLERLALRLNFPVPHPVPPPPSVVEPGAAEVEVIGAEATVAILDRLAAVPRTPPPAAGTNGAADGAHPHTDLGPADPRDEDDEPELQAWSDSFPSIP